MKIISYKYEEAGETGLKFLKSKFQNLNLLVGASGSGKTKLLNSIFELGSYVHGARKLTKPGRWEVNFEQNNKVYQWNLSTTINKENNLVVVDKETLSERASSGNDTVIIERDSMKFRFDKKDLPKLPKDQSSILLLKDKELINPVYKSFNILRRDFSENAILEAKKPGMLPDDPIIESIINKKGIHGLFEIARPLNVKLFLLKKHFPEIFSKINDYYLQVFPFVKRIKIPVIQLSHIPVPVISVKEKSINSFIQIQDFSSGMIKVLLILTDICCLPKEYIYIIDEYENSLGFNAIDFLPEFLGEFENTNQFFVTSHHPYIIKNISPENWSVLRRTGHNIDIKRGEELISSESVHDYFTQLINNPFYTEEPE